MMFGNRPEYFFNKIPEPDKTFYPDLDTYVLLNFMINTNCGHLELPQ